MKIFTSIFFITTLVACTSREPLMSVSMVSMTKYSFSQGNLQEVGLVETRFCKGDPAISSTSSNVGMIDEVVLKAQKEKRADYISNVLVSREGKCIVLEGMALRKSKRSRISESLLGGDDRMPASDWVEDPDDLAPADLIGQVDEAN